MGNVTPCMVKSEARVMRPDGIVVDYTYPVQVAMLMTLYPDYMVIHCPAEDAAPGASRKIEIMDLEDRIALGESYIMYPIPPQHKEIFKTAPVASPVQAQTTPRLSYSRSLRTKISLECCRKRMVLVKFDRRKKAWRVTVRARSIVSSLLKCGRSSSAGSGKVSTEGGLVPLVVFDGNGQSFTSTCDSKLLEDCPTKSDAPLQSGYWKPDLDDIPESPYESRRHS